MQPMKKHPFSLLTPDTVLDALNSIGIRGDGRLLALNSYENRVYQAGREDAPALIVKFYRPARWTDEAILEEHVFVEALLSREIPVVPALTINGHTLHEYNGFRFSVFDKFAGRAPDLDNSDTLKWLGRYIGRIHATGALSVYRHRPTLDIQSFGTESVDYLLARDFIPVELQEIYRGVAAHALEGVVRCFSLAGNVSVLRLHGDCHPGNVLWSHDHGNSHLFNTFLPPQPAGEFYVNKGPHFVDFDDSRMGPAIQDLWMLLSGERDEQTRQLSDLLAGYRDFYDFNPRELHLIEALRTLRLIHYSAWIARRWDDAAFTTAFPWFNTQRYWQDRILEFREQIALMNEPPLTMPGDSRQQR
jgi:Ser/Thr protein kinase RdoA (MazF antagonist)